MSARKLLEELRFTDPLSDLDYKVRGEKMIDQTLKHLTDELKKRWVKEEHEDWCFSHKNKSCNCGRRLYNQARKDCLKIVEDFLK